LAMFILGLSVAGNLAAFYLIIQLFHWIGLGLILFDDERRALWDYQAGTVVRYRPRCMQRPGSDSGALTSRLRELNSAWHHGLLTRDEYERMREEILNRL
jgi:hypothetical protein